MVWTGAEWTGVEDKARIRQNEVQHSFMKLLRRCGMCTGAITRSHLKWLKPSPNGSASKRSKKGHGTEACTTAFHRRTKTAQTLSSRCIEGLVDLMRVPCKCLRQLLC